MRECLDSILLSRQENLELILIDDGSVDGSLGIAKEYASIYPNIYVFSQRNSGPSLARNLGTSKAQGDYICYFDADDYINPHSFSSSLEFLKSNSPDILVSDFHRVNDSGVILDRVYQISDEGSVITDRGYLKEYLSAPDCVWNVWRYVFRRDFLLSNGLSFREGYNCAEDLEFVIRALITAKSIAFIHEPYYNYRVNYGASLTRSYTARRTREMIEMFSCAWEFLDSLSCSEAEILQSKISREYVLSLSLYADSTYKEKKAVLSALQDGIFLLTGARGVAFRVAAFVVRLFGIPFASQVLHILKRSKRMLRSVLVWRATSVS